MRKKFFGLSLGAMLFALCVSAHAQQAKKVFRIGYLSSLSSSSESTRAEAIRLALRELGYIEGQNIVIESRYGEGKLNRAPELAAELVRLKVNIILITGRSRRDAKLSTRPSSTGSNTEFTMTLLRELQHPSAS